MDLLMIGCGFDVHLVKQRIHNKSNKKLICQSLIFYQQDSPLARVNITVTGDATLAR